MFFRSAFSMALTAASASWSKWWLLHAGKRSVIISVRRVWATGGGDAEGAPGGSISERSRDSDDRLLEVSILRHGSCSERISGAVGTMLQQVCAYALTLNPPSRMNALVPVRFT